MIAPLTTDRLGTLTSRAQISRPLPSAFGERVGTAPSTPYGWKAGWGYRESSPGLTHIGHRMYDPTTGRFLTRDPILDGSNHFAYCDNDPLNNVDPTGLIFIPPQAVGAGAAISLADGPFPFVDAVVVIGLGLWAGYEVVEATVPKIAEWWERRNPPRTWVPRRQPDVPKVERSSGGKRKRVGVGKRKGPNREIPSSSRKQAEDKARKKGQGKPLHHTPDKGKPHFHPTDRYGRKIPGPHYTYPSPGGRGPTKRGSN